MCLKKVISTGDVLPINVANDFISKFKPCYFSHLYGSSEAGVVAMNPACRGTTELKSVGIPSYEVEIKIVDPETNSKLGAYETGEICVKSPQVFKGYLNDDLLTKAQFDEEGFFKTGDAGYYDENGYVYFASRFSSRLKYDCWLFSTIELEDILEQHEAVKEAAVIAIDAGRMGKMPKAFVTLKEEWKNKIDESALLEWFDSQVVYYKQIRG
ncbi:hypothetical protein B4U79_15067, partial [Dinothrombium tinctorium]